MLSRLFQLKKQEHKYETKGRKTQRGSTVFSKKSPDLLGVLRPLN